MSNFKLCIDIYKTLPLSRRVLMPTMFAWGAYRSTQYSKMYNDEELILLKPLAPLVNGFIYASLPYVFLFKAAARAEIEWFQPHLRKRHGWVFYEV